LLLFGALWAAEAATLGLRAGAGKRRNPLLDMYRNWAVHYDQDAREAEAAAEKYNAMTQALASRSPAGAASVGVRQEMSRLDAKDLANKVWDFEAKLRDPRPGNAARAAAEAEKPYKDEWNEYVGARNSYVAAAAQHALRVKANTELIQQLRAYAEQNRAEGDGFKADQYTAQADSLMKQVSSEESLAKHYEAMAARITKVLPSLWDMGYTAASFAAYKENPGGNLPSSQLMPYTVAPPPMDLVMKAYAAQAAEAAKAAMAAPR